MSLQVIETDAAQGDIIRIALYIARHGDFDASDRVVAAIRASYEKLAENPGIGAVRDFGIDDLKGLRMFTVPRYPVYLIYYQTTDSQLVVRRVYHGARDIARLMENPDAE